MDSVVYWMWFCWLGYFLAACLYYGVGKVFWIPIAVDLVYDILGSGLGIWGNNPQTMLISTLYEMLLLFWMIYLSGILHSRYAIWAVFGLAVVTSFVGIASTIIYQNIGAEQFGKFLGSSNPDRTWIRIATFSIHIWSTCTFLFTLSVILNQSLIRKLRGKFSNLLVNPRYRIMIPVCLFSGIVGLSQLYRGVVPDAFYAERFKIAAVALGWGWVAVEFPFFLMYHRMIRGHAGQQLDS